MPFFLDCPKHAVPRGRLITNISDLFTLDTSNIKKKKELVKNLLFGHSDLSTEENQLLFTYVHDFIVQTKRFEFQAS